MPKKAKDKLIEFSKNIIPKVAEVFANKGKSNDVPKKRTSKKVQNKATKKATNIDVIDAKKTKKEDKKASKSVSKKTTKKAPSKKIKEKDKKEATKIEKKVEKKAEKKTEKQKATTKVASVNSAQKEVLTPTLIDTKSVKTTNKTKSSKTPKSSNKAENKKATSKKQNSDEAEKAEKNIKAKTTQVNSKSEKTKTAKVTDKSKTQKASKKTENIKPTKETSKTAKSKTPKVTDKNLKTSKTVSKTASSKTNNAKVAKTKKTTRKKATKAITIGEYYDLPTGYDQTIVKILAQTPTILFVYWDISEKDRKNLIKKYGEDFFEKTYPYLIVINKTKNYQYEVEVNDYANSWYLHIPDSDCKYEVILMRRNRNSNIIAENELTITSSNNMDSPNDHILFERLGKTVFFKDVKNGNVMEKDISSFAFMHNIGRIYNIYDLYKEIYKNELNGDELGVSLTSSHFSSNFK